MEITVNGEVLTPRMRMASAPFAYQAEKLDGFEGAEFVKRAGDTMTGNLQVAGTIYSTTGGVKFPDGSVQTTAATTGGNTLDQAYNQGGPGAGRTINASSGAVNIASSGGLLVNGKVGIGTTSPSATLHVQGVAAKVLLRDSNPTGNGNPSIDFEDSVGNRLALIDIVEDSNAAVFTSGSGMDLRLSSNSLPYQFVLRSNGNVGVGTASPTKTLEVVGTTRTTVLEITSDRNAKADVENVNPGDILAKLVDLPISTWAYTGDPTTRHIGPMAQDFYTAFAVGSSDKHIATVDADGVALAAIQRINQLVEQQRARIAELEAGARVKDAQMAVLAARLAALEQSLDRSSALEHAGLVRSERPSSIRASDQLGSLTAEGSQQRSKNTEPTQIRPGAN